MNSREYRRSVYFKCTHTIVTKKSYSMLSHYSVTNHSTMIWYTSNTSTSHQYYHTMDPWKRNEERRPFHPAHHHERQQFRTYQTPLTEAVLPTVLFGQSLDKQSSLLPPSPRRSTTSLLVSPTAAPPSPIGASVLDWSFTTRASETPSWFRGLVGGGIIAVAACEAHSNPMAAAESSNQPPQASSSSSALLLPPSIEPYPSSSSSPPPSISTIGSCPSCLYTGIATCTGLATYMAHLGWNDATVAVQHRPYMRGMAALWLCVGAYRWHLG